ncbi:hypothetical protein PCE1_004182 [Barthelona sp. PCE]
MVHIHGVPFTVFTLIVKQNLLENNTRYQLVLIFLALTIQVAKFVVRSWYFPIVDSCMHELASTQQVLDQRIKEYQSPIIYRCVDIGHTLVPSVFLLMNTPSGTTDESGMFRFWGQFTNILEKYDFQFVHRSCITYCLVVSFESNNRLGLRYILEDDPVAVERVSNEILQFVLMIEQLKFLHTDYRDLNVLFSVLRGDLAVTKVAGRVSIMDERHLLKKFVDFRKEMRKCVSSDSITLLVDNDLKGFFRSQNKKHSFENCYLLELTNENVEFQNVQPVSHAFASGFMLSNSTFEASVVTSETFRMRLVRLDPENVLLKKIFRIIIQTSVMSKAINQDIAFFNLNHKHESLSKMIERDIVFSKSFPFFKEQSIIHLSQKCFVRFSSIVFFMMQLFSQCAMICLYIISFTTGTSSPSYYIMFFLGICRVLLEFLQLLFVWRDSPVALARNHIVYFFVSTVFTFFILYAYFFEHAIHLILILCIFEPFVGQFLFSTLFELLVLVICLIHSFFERGTPLIICITLVYRVVLMIARVNIGQEKYRRLVNTLNTADETFGRFISDSFINKVLTSVPRTTPLIKMTDVLVLVGTFNLHNELSIEDLVHETEQYVTDSFFFTTISNCYISVVFPFFSIPRELNEFDEFKKKVVRFIDLACFLQQFGVIGLIFNKQASFFLFKETVFPLMLDKYVMRKFILDILMDKSTARGFFVTKKVERLLLDLCNINNRISHYFSHVTPFTYTFSFENGGKFVKMYVRKA